MDLIDILLSRKIILLSVVVAVLPFFGAVVAMVLPAVRQVGERRRARIARKKEARAARQTARQEKKQGKGKKAKAPRDIEKARAETESAQAAATPPPADAPKTEPEEGDVPDAESSTPDEVDEDEQTEEDTLPEDDETGDEEESPFEDALLDIFAEETESTYYDVLLHGLDEVAIDELAALGSQVADELSAYVSTPAERGMAG